MSAELMLWLMFGSFVIFWGVTAWAICRKGDFLAECETRWGKFHLEAKDRSKKLRRK